MGTACDEPAWRVARRQPAQYALGILYSLARLSVTACRAGADRLGRDGPPQYLPLRCLSPLSAAPPPPPSFAPIVVPPSTFSADMAKTWGDASLPEGKVTFLVGDDEERIEHVSKCNLCARSVVFRTMFGIGMKERDAAEVTVSHTDF